MKKDIIVILVLLSVIVAIGILLVSAQIEFPSTFYGSVKISGVDAPVGTVIKAYIGGSTECGSFTTTNEGWYSISVAPDDVDHVGCGKEGDPVTFTIDGTSAISGGTWHENTIDNPGQVLYLDTITPTGCSLGADCTITACTGWVDPKHNAIGGHDSCSSPYTECVRDSGGGSYDQACCGGQVNPIMIE